MLDSKGLCNLTTINAYAFVRPDNTLDRRGLLEAQRLSVRAGYRMTCVELELPKWDEKQKRDKLVGCSLTGWQDMINAVGVNKEEEAELITIHVRNHEWEQVEEWVWENWDEVVALSFLSLEDNFYKLLPYESIDEEEYNLRVRKMKPFIPSLISKYEIIEEQFDVGTDGCDSGACPVR